MDVSHLTEDEMADVKKEVLTRLRPYLCEKIRADRHFDYLRSRKILTRDDTEEISCRITQTKKTGLLLDYLAENPRGLDALVESIQQGRTLNFLITKITDEVQKVKNEKIESLRAGASSSSSSFLPTQDTSGVNKDLSRTLSYESNLASTMFYNGERSPCTSDALRFLNRPAASSHGKEVLSSMRGGSMAVSSSQVSSTLPRPGDPGAPPLPQEVLLLPEASSNMDAGPDRSTAISGGDVNFQPLRSRSTPTSMSYRDLSPQPPPKSY
ncbi:B-cell lymphoma/leukemia 10 [Salmo trutta]|uniref:B-cell lymphoma/leukemia 10 n=1 Tax=Salmo trutta TaxID=8032 RepID=A0A673ZA72_SALTR|nr:B-cell lymphoma/leukemia 10-like [Salmo trutta]